MIDEDIYIKNLLALSSRESILSSKLSQIDPNDKIISQKARNGSDVPVYKTTERNYPLHSLFDPDKEGIKLSKQYSSSGYLIFLGLGGAFQILPFLEMNNISGILIIESDLSLFKSLLGQFNYRKLILDPRVHFLIETAPSDIESYLFTHCFPALYGDIQLIPLRSRINHDKEYFSSVFNSIKSSLETLADDFTVQSSFGTRWFTNTIRNLSKAESSNSVLPPIREAIITAAGPSLEDNFDLLKNRSKDCYLIATDTSYPVLRQIGVKPDVILSIDCQHISYYHFLDGVDKDIPIVLDLASPSLLTRMTDNPIFFTSGHPFSVYLNQKWRSFPQIDTSGGNVTHAALSLATNLGAKKISLIGADYCYPNGKSYSRGTYVYPFFEIRSERMNSLENNFTNFVLRNSQVHLKKRGTNRIYTTQPLGAYRERLQTSFYNSESRIINLSPHWEFISNDKIKKQKGTSTFFGSGAISMDWKSFLRKYLDGLQKIPYATTPTAHYLDSLSIDQRTLWLTLLPALARHRKISKAIQPDSAELLNNVIDWARELIARYIESE